MVAVWMLRALIVARTLTSGCLLLIGGSLSDGRRGSTFAVGLVEIWRDVVGVAAIVAGAMDERIVQRRIVACCPERGFVILECMGMMECRRRAVYVSDDSVRFR